MLRRRFVSLGSGARHVVGCLMLLCACAIHAAPLVIGQSATLAYGQPDVHLSDAAIDGNRIVAVGRVKPATFRVRVWERSATPSSWIESASFELTFTDGDAQYARDPSVQVSGNLLVLYFESLARFYTYEYDGSQWRFGKAVNTGGDTLYSGSTLKISPTSVFVGLINPSNAGHEVRMYYRDAAGNWYLGGSVAEGSVYGESGDLWAPTVFDAWNDTIVMVNGAEGTDVVFTRTSAGWVLTDRFTHSDVDESGLSVAMAGYMYIAGDRLRPDVVRMRTPYAPGRWGMQQEFFNSNYIQSSDSVDASLDMVAVGVTKRSTFPVEPRSDSILIWTRGSDDPLFYLVAELVPATLPASPLDEFEVSDRTVIARSLAGELFVFEVPRELPAQPTVVDDDFEAGVQKDGYTLRAGRWTVVDTPNSKVFRQSDWDSATASWDSEVRKNQSVEADVTLTAVQGADEWAGVAACYQGPDDYYYLSLRTSNKVQLRRKVHGTFTTLASSDFPVEMNRTYRLRIEAVGGQVRGYVDGNVGLRAVDRTFSSGSPALLTHGVHADYDNVRITSDRLQTFFSDSFVTAHAQANGLEHGAAWEKVAGTWVDPGAIQYFAQTYTGSGLAYAITGRESSDQVIEARVEADSFGTEGWVGLIAQFWSRDTFYYLRISRGEVSIRKFVDGRNKKLASKGMSFASGAWYTARLEVVGTELRGYIDGRLVVQAHEADRIVPGRYGLATFKAAAKFDDFRAQQP